MSRPADILFPSHAAAREAGYCAFSADGSCQSTEAPKVLTEADFRDEISFREFKINGMCQDCQDDFYGVD